MVHQGRREEKMIERGEARVWIEEMVGDGKVFNMHGGSCGARAARWTIARE